MRTGDYQYVSVRKYNGVSKTWGPYSPPALWAYIPNDAIASGYVADFDNNNISVYVDSNGFITTDAEPNTDSPTTAVGAKAKWPSFIYSPKVFVNKSDGTAIPYGS